MTQKTDRAAQSADRKRIRDAGVLDALLTVARGEPLPVRDPAGEIVGWERPDVAVRVAVLEKLAQRVLPSLKSIELTGESGMTFVVNAPFAVPGSKRPGTLEAQVTHAEFEAGLRRVAAAVTDVEDEDE
jgi:hypothetical protein